MATVTSHNQTYHISRWMTSSSPQEGQDIVFAIGTLGFRNQRNRKRMSTGEFVWSDEADITFALALINWTSNRSFRVGTRRSVFLQQFLSRYGFTKTRKQIASRLQVLKGEWSNSQYLDLLKDPDDSEDPCSRRGSASPSFEEQYPPSPEESALNFTSSRTSSQCLQGTDLNSAMGVSPITSISQEGASFGAVPLSSSQYASPHSNGSCTQESYVYNQTPRTTLSTESPSPMEMTRRHPHSQPAADLVDNVLIPSTLSLPSAGYSSIVGRLSHSPTTPPDNGYTSYEYPTSEQAALGNYFPHSYPYSYQ